MSNMKCPICGEKIEHIEDGWCNCKNRCLGSGSISLWQELIRTRKALDISVDALKEIDKTRCGVDVKLYAVNHKSLNAGNVFCWTTIDDLHNALEQITALEQKDVK